MSNEDLLVSMRPAYLVGIGQDGDHWYIRVASAMPGRVVQDLHFVTKMERDRFLAARPQLRIW
jgi:hypothetical protein